MNLVKQWAVTLAMAIALPASVTLAAEQQGYYVNDKIKGYDKGSFVVLTDDDVNFRAAAEDGAVLKVLRHHSLLRVLGQEGAWLQAVSDGVSGYLYASYTGAGARDTLTQDDFAVGYAALGSRFDKQQAVQKLGAVQSETYDKKKKLYTYTYKSVALAVARKKQVIAGIRVTEPKYITMRGVSVGDSAGRAVGQYGLPDAVVYGDNVTTYEYFWQDNAQQPLRFAIEVDKQSKVQAFVLELLSKK